MRERERERERDDYIVTLPNLVEPVGVGFRKGNGVGFWGRGQAVDFVSTHICFRFFMQRTHELIQTHNHAWWVKSKIKQANDMRDFHAMNECDFKIYTFGFCLNSFKFFFFFFFFARISMSLALNFLVFLKQTKNNSCSPLFLSLSLSLSNRQSLLSGSSFNDFYISPAFSRAKPFLKVKIIIKNVRFFFIFFF